MHKVSCWLRCTYHTAPRSLVSCVKFPIARPRLIDNPWKISPDRRPTSPHPLAAWLAENTVPLAPFALEPRL
ncbi:hypothetical protein IAQ61_004778 [Plenodomus lingam]|uniref:uncharacterized protein n=1 Tax=Leptosphaeria maculans TaxID=5022 RepID=UPI00331E92B3|nr:hypothetical protein IAQ61_004778 [Plenodomus lingam]